MPLTAAQESVKSDEWALRAELETAGVRFKGKVCKCPFHDDHRPSGGIFQRDDGYWHFKCHVCGIDGDIFDIRALLKKTKVEDELKAASGTTPQRKTPPPPSPRIYASMDDLVATIANVEAVHRYTNPDTGALEYATIRAIDRTTGKKKFVQCSPTAGGWWMKQPQGLLPIYNRTRVKAAEVVVVVEGEKCVEYLAFIGIVATTSPQGAGKAHLADWSMLAGKTVYLWPDNDPENPHTHPKPGLSTGIEHMREVKKILQMLSPPPVVHWIHCEELDLPDKGDVVDFLLPYSNAEEKRIAIEAVLGNAEPIGFAADYAKEMDATIEGKRRALPLGGWMIATKASRAMMPGTVTCICGDPGSGKSLLLMEAMVAWHELGVKACIYELEDDRLYHLRRAHAIASGVSDLTDNEWVEQNGPLARELTQKHRQRLDELGQRIWDAPDESASLEMLAAWVEQRAKSGFEIICIDPITAATADDKPWIADLKFINQVKTIARRYGCRVILVTHPKKTSKPSSGVHDTAGGAAYPRFTHTVLWIERNDAEAEMAVRKHKHFPAELHTPNRVLRITKARNGPGAGKRIAFDFDPKTLRFEEIGLIEKT